MNRRLLHALLPAAVLLPGLTLAQTPADPHAGHVMPTPAAVDHSQHVMPAAEPVDH